MDERILVLGTNNINKIVEIVPHLRDLNVIPIPAKMFGFFDPDETGDMLDDNALIKAEAAAKLSNQWALSDDSGLFIDALDGRPGVISARYAGPGCSFSDNIKKVLEEMKDIPTQHRRATFRCVIALCMMPGGLCKTYHGHVNGMIIEEPRGKQGFGYDPIFVPDGYDKTFAEMEGFTWKNEISHRGIAMNAFKEGLTRFLKFG